MWNQKYTKDQTDISNEDKNSHDSQKDSGFLSGTILNSGDINSDDENEYEYQPDPPTKQEPKILSLRQNPMDERENKAKVQENVVCDSGIDLEGGISELSLQDCDNDEPSIVAEPDSESNNNKEITCDSFWEMCYTQDDDGDTQLHLAIMQELERESIYIINVSPHPILLNILNDVWETPLHLAVITHQPKIVRSLILAGADPSIQNFQGNTALHLVCASGDLECAKALTEPLTQEERIALRGRNPPAIPQNLEQRNYTGSMCIHIAVMEGHIEIVNHLLRMGADIEAREGLRGYTPLQLSIDYKKFDVTRFLLNDCKPNLETENYARLNAYEVALRVDKNFAKELVDKFNFDDDYYYCECHSDSYSDYDSDDENDTYSKAQASKISNIVNRSQVQVS